MSDIKTALVSSRPVNKWVPIGDSRFLTFLFLLFKGRQSYSFITLSWWLKLSYDPENLGGKLIEPIKDAHQLNFVVKSLIVIDKNKQNSSSQTKCLK